MANEQDMGPTSGLTPYLTVKGAKAAIEFYKKAFGAKQRFVMPAEDGERLMHAFLEINGAPLMLSDHFAEYSGVKNPAAPAGVALHLQVKNADKAWAKALAAGATVKMPISDTFWGDRFGQVADPFGHTWSIASPLSKAAAKAAQEAWAAQQAQAAPPKPAKKVAKKAPAKKVAKRA